jgi:hypothetical protein
MARVMGSRQKETVANAFDDWRAQVSATHELAFKLISAREKKTVANALDEFRTHLSARLPAAALPAPVRNTIVYRTWKKV